MSFLTWTSTTYCIICCMVLEPNVPIETQLVTITEDLMRNSLAGSSQTDIVLFDFSKAFDKVNHQKLLLKLYHYGIRGPSLKWIQAFFSGRTQTVVLENEKYYTLKDFKNAKNEIH